MVPMVWRRGHMPVRVRNMAPVPARVMEVSGTIGVRGQAIADAVGWRTMPQNTMGFASLVAATTGGFAMPAADSTQSTQGQGA